MKNRIFLTIATLLVITGLLLSVAAQNFGGGDDPQLQIKVPIKCLMGHGDVLSEVMAKNNTSQTIKKGKVIYYSTNGGANHSIKLDADLPAGDTRNIGKANYPFTCQAWFFKK